MDREEFEKGIKEEISKSAVMPGYTGRMEHIVTKESLLEFISIYESIDFEHAWGELEGKHPRLDALVETVRSANVEFDEIVDALMAEFVDGDGKLRDDGGNEYYAPYVEIS